MPKTISSGLEAHTAQEVTTLATCWQITRRDGTVLRFTDHDQDLPVGGEQYLAAVGYERSPVESSDSARPSSVEVRGILDSPTITEIDIRAGLYDYAEVELFAVNWQNTSQGILRIRKGRTGEIRTLRDGTFEGEIRGLASLFSRNIVELYGPECRADLGDARCKIPIRPPPVQRSTSYALGVFVNAGVTNRIHECTTAGTTDVSAPTYDPDVGDTTTDGTAVFTTRQAWTRSATVSSVVDRSIFGISVDEDRDVTGWFSGGLVEFLTGNNSGFRMEVKSWAKTGSDAGLVVLYLPVPFSISVSDTLLIHPGCFKRLLDDCRDKFDNVPNFRGEPYLPGLDERLRFPDAR